MAVTKTWSRNMGLLNINPNQTGLVAGYNMVPRSDGTIEDLSGNGNHGTINGSGFEFTEIGPSMRFAANSDDITTLYTSSPATFSVCGWFNLKSRGQGTFGRLFQKGVSVLELFISNSDTDLNLRYENGSGVQNYNVTDGYLQNQNIHIAVTYADGSIKYYLNSELTYTVVDSIVLDASALLIGGTGGSRSIDGNVSNFQWFETELTAAEIQAEYQAGAKAVNWKSDYGVTTSVAAEAAPGELSNSPARIISGTHKIATDTIGGKTCKVVECVTAGVVAIPSAYFFGNETQAAHGSFEWWMLKGGGANVSAFGLISDQKEDPATGANGYEFRFNADESVRLFRYNAGSPAAIQFTQAGFISLSTWYKCKVSISASGEFTSYINNQLLDVSGGGGTNPVTDTTHTTSKYIVLDLDAGDKVAYAAPNGDCSIVKYQGVV
jgi:hypothetical protein